ncbi:hypothetical protein PsYK624_112060 [Phanerochaete sordida]|uniref:Fungal-type protein kinase domain-containing protein n=1 Tax=Phanerochaete sordida TaxID=48140 RepID=A0A9P3GHD5_9APHY|nr:hypothetical protein PsYK624_112060 [Phanerochaete sordida]
MTMATHRECYKPSVAGCGSPTQPTSWPIQTRSHFSLSAPANLATDGNRDGMLEDLQEHVPQVEWSYFEDALLPPLRLKTGVTVKDIVKKLEANSTVTAVHGRNRWSAFAQGPPSTFAGSHTEDEVFESVSDIITAITRAYDSKTKMTLQYRSRPKNVPRSETRTNKSKPDGYFMDNLAPGALTEVPHRWVNVMIPSEYKLSDSPKDMNDNATQILWSLTHLLREDPRRRFVLGFSIEDTRLRLWFMSRSDIFVSFPEPDFTTAIERLVSLFLRLIWAAPHELGIDETIAHMPGPDEHGGIQYEIQVGNEWYRTKRLISAIGAESPRGRGTRVWEVRQLDKRGGTEIGPSLVLKDSWVDEDRLREFRVLDAIHESANSASKKDQAILTTHLLSVHAAADVMVRDVPDDTHTVIRRGMLPPWENTIPVQKDINAKKVIKDDLPLVDAMLLPPKKSAEHVVFHRKVHHRVVFKEMGTTIMEAETFALAFKTLKDIVKVLRVLHKCGWVHRDISAGNVLIVDGVAKLADVEYAKRETDDTTHSVRTGTAFFMAVEVNSRDYNFDEAPAALHNIREEDESGDESDGARGGDDSDDDSEPETEATRKARLDDNAPVPSRKPKRKPSDDVLPALGGNHTRVFRHNPIHDLESVLWLGLYIVFCSILIRFDDADEVSEKDWDAYMKARKNTAAKLFNDPDFRPKMLLPSTAFRKELWNQHPRIAEICQVFNDVRRAIVEQYQRVESTPGPITFEHASSGKIHNRIRDLLDPLANDAEYTRINGTLLKFARSPLMLAQQREEMQGLLNEKPRGTKRGISEGADEPRKKLREKTGTYTQDAYILRDRGAGVSDSVREAYRQI